WTVSQRIRRFFILPNRKGVGENKREKDGCDRSEPSGVRRGSPDPADGPTGGLRNDGRPPVTVCGSDHCSSQRCPRPATTGWDSRQNLQPWFLFCGVGRGGPGGAAE